MGNRGPQMGDSSLLSQPWSVARLCPVRSGLNGVPIWILRRRKVPVGLSSAEDRGYTVTEVRSVDGGPYLIRYSPTCIS